MLAGDLPANEAFKLPLPLEQGIKKASQERLSCSGEPQARTRGLTLPLGNGSLAPTPRINFNLSQLALSPPSLLCLPLTIPACPRASCFPRFSQHLVSSPTHPSELTVPFASSWPLSLKPAGPRPSSMDPDSFCSPCASSCQPVFCVIF